MNSNNCSLPKLASYTTKTASAETNNKLLEKQKISTAHTSALTIQAKLDINKIDKSGKISERPEVVRAKKEEHKKRIVV